MEVILGVVGMIGVFYLMHFFFTVPLIYSIPVLIIGYIMYLGFTAEKSEADKKKLIKAKERSKKRDEWYNRVINKS